MADTLAFASLAHLTRKYYARLRELLEAVPEESLAARAGDEGLTVEEMVRHVCRADAWYRSLTGATPPPEPETVAGKPALMASLATAEQEMLRFLEGLPPQRLSEEWEVPVWWGEDRDQPILVILVHSLAHKYYHCGQLQSILHLLNAL
jgi:uncharacterized damage-inducible protein DinB